jgi:hypothetical protein
MIISFIPNKVDRLSPFDAFVALGLLQSGGRMVWTISVILLSVWLVGVGTPSTLHGYIHLLLVAVVVVILVPLFRRRKQPLD